MVIYVTALALVIRFFSKEPELDVVDYYVESSQIPKDHVHKYSQILFKTTEKEHLNIFKIHQNRHCKLFNFLKSWLFDNISWTDHYAW